MSDKKSITIASDSLLGGASSKRKSSKRSSGSGEHKIRPSSIVQPSTLKKTLLERIKQHQRTRERSRRDDSGNADDSSSSTAADASASAKTPASTDNFTQSIDFLRKLAMKRRQQQTQRRGHSSSSATAASGAAGLPEAKTPEAKMMNQVAETLHHGEILTNTGLLGLPVVPTIVSSATYTPQTPTPPSPPPMISLGAMPFQPVMTSSFAPDLQSVGTAAAAAVTAATPNISQLADMYNNTVSAVDAVTAAAATDSGTTSEPPLHIPTKPEDYLPSIFIKEEPPHGCLKNGKKPTFREWATNMLKKPVDTIKDMFGGGGGGGGTSDDVTTPVAGHASQTDNQQQQQSSVGGVHANLNPEQVAGMRLKIRKTHKKRFRIGKHDDVVGVLLKNKQTQRHIQSQHLTLKQKTIGEIRKYLYEHHLLKIGSNAPPDVLRRMYEDAILTGDVKNTNKDVLLHNFMSGGGGE